MLCVKNRSEGVVAISFEAFNLHDFGDAPRRSSALQKHQNIDSLGNEPARNRDYGFLNQLLKSIESTAR